MEVTASLRIAEHVSCLGGIMSIDATNDDQDDDQIDTEDMTVSFPAVQALVRLIEVAPGFREHWEGVKWMASTTYPIRGDTIFSQFALYLIPRAKQGQMEDASKVFAFIEEAMNSSHDEWSNGAAVGFLEGISNLVPSTIVPETVIPLMGPASRKYCYDWAKWTGADAATLALWGVEADSER